jgi:hypothetical protein
MALALMGYSVGDLDVFTPLILPAELEGTSYFELHAGEIAGPQRCWIPGSLCVRDSGFDFMCECFHAASKNFDYFEFVRFGFKEANLLISEIKKFVADVLGSKCREVIFSRYASIHGKSIWKEVPEKAIAGPLLNLLAAVRNYTQSAIDGGKPLWVLGM